MLKRNITYTDLNGDVCTEEFYFNLTKTELLELEAEDDGLESLAKKLMEERNNSRIVAKFKEIVLLSYGEKSLDGKRFIKNEAMRLEFSQSMAFDALFIELTTNENAIILFIKGVMPQDLVAAVEAELDQDKPKGLPRIGPKPPMPPSTKP